MSPEKVFTRELKTTWIYNKTKQLNNSREGLFVAGGRGGISEFHDSGGSLRCLASGPLSLPLELLLLMEDIDAVDDVDGGIPGFLGTELPPDVTGLWTTEDGVCVGELGVGLYCLSVGL